MRSTSPVRAFVVAAVLTNPLVWFVAALALLVVACGLVVLLYWVLFEFARNELFPPRSSARRHPSGHDDWPLLPPSLEVVAQLDEEGRVELLVEDLLALEAQPPAEQEVIRLESDTAPVPSVLRPVPAAARTTKPKPISTATPLTRGQAEQLPHEQLVTLARRAGAVAANKRWSRAKLVEAVVAAR